MQYSRIFGPGRLTKAILVGMALCLVTVPSAEAGRRKSHPAHHTRSAAAARSDDSGITSSPRYAAFVVDDKSGRVLYARNEDELRHPASLTKMMTLYILFGELEAKRVTLSTPFTASARSAAQAPSKLGLRPGQTITVEDAIRALVTKSANDVAVTIAENIGGSEDAFARRMTQTARRIGMSRTTFYNASGLPNSAQYTTARDMVTLGRALQERYPTYYRYFSTRSFAWGNQVIGNHNNLLRRIDGIDGIKTGYTEASGFNLVSSLWRDDRHLVAAVMGGSSARQRDDHMATLLTRSIAAASPGSKTSIAVRDAGRDDDVDDDAPAQASAPAPARTGDAKAPLPTPVVRADDTPPAAPMALVAREVETPVPVNPNQPRIARSDVVPIVRTTDAPRASDDRGAAVAMARAILLPQSGRPPVAAPAPVRTASVAPVAPVADETPPSLANATISLAEVADVTASLPRRKTAESVPATSSRSGWLVQIGAFDGETAARGALDRARDKAGPVLGRAEGYTESIGGGSGRLWRARFAGFKDQSAADGACKALQRKKVACLALRQ